ncbi:MAG TPA: hypothetical protein VF952_00140 [Chloroflexia bacterium]
MTTSPSGMGEADDHLFDEWVRGYIHLGLLMDRLEPGTVDSYFGPASWRTGVENESLPTPQALQKEAEGLLSTLPGMGYPADRRGFLERQVRALHTQARVLGGEQIPLTEQAQLIFDINPERVPEDVFADAHAKLDAALPGQGSLYERRNLWRKQFEVPIEKLLPLLNKIAGEVRSRTIQEVPLPEGEAIELSLVSDKPWGGYNWYLGSMRSLIEINTDLPVSSLSLVDYLAHEGYPGHHTEHALREAVQYRERGQGEYAITILNSPESLIAEAIATTARGLIFEGNSDLEWAAEHIFLELGIEPDIEQISQVREAQRDLAAVSGNASFLLNTDGRSPDEVAQYLVRWGLRRQEEAQHSLGFLSSPLFRVYVFTYYYGQLLLEPLLAGPDRFKVYHEIATGSVYPSLLEERRRSLEGA